jgi:uncharacterized membrane protein
VARDAWLTKNRLETLVDGIFAIAMTLLVLNFRLPVMTDQQAQVDLAGALSKLTPHLFAFFLSFLLLAVFWMVHHRQFHFIDKVDGPFIWLNILMLGFIVLIPFTTSLVGEYERNLLSVILFEINLLAIGLSIWLYWWYASRNHRLIAADVTDEQIRYGLLRSMILPIVSLVAIGLAFITPRYSTMVYISIPFIMIIIRKG